MQREMIYTKFLLSVPAQLSSDRRVNLTIPVHRHAKLYVTLATKSYW